MTSRLGPYSIRPVESARHWPGASALEWVLASGGACGRLCVMSGLPDFDPQPITLEGTHVRLEPLDRGHAEELLVAAADERIWDYMPMPPPTEITQVERMIADAHRALEAGTDVPFAIICKGTAYGGTGRAVGSTRYLDIRRRDRGLEIGWTWLGTEVHRSPVNTECKYLLLRHAFEDLGAFRVQLKTDGRNQRSQAAIARIGAKREGVLRRNLLVWDGHVRDSVYFSVLDSEWPDVRADLERKLAREPNA